MRCVPVPRRNQLPTWVERHKFRMTARCEGRRQGEEPRQHPALIVPDPHHHHQQRPPTNRSQCQ